MQVFFSVIIPTFNRAHLVGRAIASVIEQEFSDFEIVVIDDGSTDNTADVLHDLVARDARIKYHYCLNHGAAAARLLACPLAHGKYFTFLDSDHEYLPEHL